MFKVNDSLADDCVDGVCLCVVWWMLFKLMNTKILYIMLQSDRLRNIKEFKGYMSKTTLPLGWDDRLSKNILYFKEQT